MLKVEDLKKDLNIGECGDNFCDYGGNQYICDVISYIADNNIDVYTYDLLKWLPDNYEWVEEAISQGLCDTSKPDIPRMIMMGQYVYYTDNLYKNLDDIMLNYCLHFIMCDLLQEDISEDDFEKLKEKCTNVDNNETLDIFEDFCRELFDED